MVDTPTERYCLMVQAHPAHTYEDGDGRFFACGGKTLMGRAEVATGDGAGVSHFIKTDEVDALLNTRTDVYGDRLRNMRDVAKIWGGYLHIEMEAWQIPLLMAAYKRYRTFETPDYSDNVDDDEGWTRMFREQYEADFGPIIEARTVEEYTAKKQARHSAAMPEMARAREFVENAEAAAETEAMSEWEANLAQRERALGQRLGFTVKPDGQGWWTLDYGHGEARKASWPEVSAWRAAAGLSPLE